VKRSPMKLGKPLGPGSSSLKQTPLKQGKTTLKKSPLKQGTSVLKKSPLKQGTSVLKKSPLKQGTSVLKKSPLKQGDSVLAQTPLKPRSVKCQTFMREERVPLIKQLIAAGVGCEIGPLLRHQGIEESRLCSGHIQGLHELRKRGSGGSLSNLDNLIPSCNWCNGWVEENPDLAWMMQLVVRPGDPDWERLGKRQD